MEKIESNPSRGEEISYRTEQGILWLLNNYRDPREFESFLEGACLSESVFSSEVFYEAAKRRYESELEEVLTKYDGVGWEGISEAHWVRQKFDLKEEDIKKITSKAKILKDAEKLIKEGFEEGRPEIAYIVKSILEMNDQDFGAMRGDDVKYRKDWETFIKVKEAMVYFLAEGDPVGAEKTRKTHFGNRRNNSLVYETQEFIDAAKIGFLKDIREGAFAKAIRLKEECSLMKDEIGGFKELGEAFGCGMAARVLADTAHSGNGDFWEESCKKEKKKFEQWPPVVLPEIDMDQFIGRGYKKLIEEERWDLVVLDKKRFESCKKIYELFLSGQLQIFKNGRSPLPERGESLRTLRGLAKADPAGIIKSEFYGAILGDSVLKSGEFPFEQEILEALKELDGKTLDFILDKYGKPGLKLILDSGSSVPEFGHVCKLLDNMVNRKEIETGAADKLKEDLGIMQVLNKRIAHYFPDAKSNYTEIEKVVRVLEAGFSAVDIIRFSFLISPLLKNNAKK